MVVDSAGTEEGSVATGSGEGEAETQAEAVRAVAVGAERAAREESAAETGGVAPPAHLAVASTVRELPLHTC